MEKKTTIKITYLQYQTIKALFNVVASDESRGVLQYVHYNPKHKRLESCDGHILRFEDIDLGEENLLFRKEDFSLTNKELSQFCREWRTMYNTCTVEYTITQPDTSSYPDVEKSFPPLKKLKIKNNAPVMTFDFDLFTKFKKSVMEKDIRAFTVINSGETTASFVYADSEYSRRLLGLIMPCRSLKNKSAIINEIIDSIENTKKGEK